MDGLITVEELREIFDISADIKPKRLERHIVAAGRKMREWVGDEAYNDALSETPDDATRKEALVEHYSGGDERKQLRCISLLQNSDL